MERKAALLLVLLLGVTIISASTTPTTTEKVGSHQKKDSDEKNATPEVIPKTTAKVDKVTTESILSTKELDFDKLLNPKETLLQEIRSLDEDASTNRFQEALAKAIKAEAQKTKPVPKLPSLLRKNATVSFKAISNSTNKNNLKDFLESEDMVYNDGLDDDDDDDDEEEEDEDEDEDDDEYDDEDDADTLDEDDMMTKCPDYCKCVGQYAAATTAKCTRLEENQSFGPGIAHLRIESADPVRLGPLAFRSRGLQQLESITFVDTPILELDKTAFDGIPYLFAVNFTRNELQDIPVDLFQNNTQLSLLTISGNPMKHSQIALKSKAREYLLDAPSVTELDFSDNSIGRLPHTTFNKMPNLVYINMKNNRLKTIDRAHFNSLESLVELDLSNNDLQDVPIDLFQGKNVQTFKVAGNNLTTLSTIIGSKITTLDASNNKIKLIHKDDLIGLPALDRLVIRSNGLKRIHQHSFSQHDQLTHLDVSDNKLTTWTEHHLRTNSRMQILIMNDNPELDTLPVFRPNTQEYDTYSIYRFECANCGIYSLSEGTFDSMPALTRLNLARNHLTGLPKNLFKLLSALIEVDLSDNRIKTLDNNMFHGAKTLNKLNLAGNLLVSLQVTPFLETPNLSKLDVSRCALERVWNEARVPLKSLRFLSVRGNRLERITVEELRATPKMSGFDVSQNPLQCDQDFNEAIQWLMEHGVTPIESLKYISNYALAEDFTESEGSTQWTDLAKVVCDGIDFGPPPRLVPHKPIVYEVPKNDLSEDMPFDHGQNHGNDFEDPWSSDERDEYEDYAPEATISYNSFYKRALWPVLTVIICTVMLLLSVVHFIQYLTKRRGRGPVIRPPMILRQGLVDNKNCGLVYKPLQEEIATPHMPKRGTFYSSSTFHYDKIVPESV